MAGLATSTDEHTKSVTQSILFVHARRFKGVTYLFESDTLFQILCQQHELLQQVDNSAVILHQLIAPPLRYDALQQKQV